VADIRWLARDPGGLVAAISDVSRVFLELHDPRVGFGFSIFLQCSNRGCGVASMIRLPRLAIQGETFPGCSTCGPPGVDEAQFESL
jgi:hypothetical protein